MRAWKVICVWCGGMPGGRDVGFSGSWGFERGGGSQRMEKEEDGRWKMEDGQGKTGMRRG